MGRFYMSDYKFIACEYELPTLYSPKLHKPDGRGINVFQCEDDLYDLKIISGMDYYDIPYYTKLQNIYDLNFRYTEERCQRLYNYLTSNCKRYKKCEVWSIWLANCSTKRSFKSDIKKELKNLEVISIPLTDLSVYILKYILDSDITPIKLTLY